MADGDLGSARGKIIIDGDFTGIDEGAKKMDGFGKKAEQVGKQTGDIEPIMRKTSNAALVSGGLIAAGFAVAVKTASDFQTQLSEIQAVSGATADQMDLINKAALRIGKDTAFSASQAASAMTELVKAGVSVSDVLNGAADATVALAAAGGVDLPEAATISANAMNQFNLAAQDLPKVADLIAGAANASAIDVGQFGYSLSQVGAVANLAGATFADTATAIALMGNAGIVGSDAGTSLKAMFQRLNPQTQAAADEMKALGIITSDGANRFYDANGKMKDLASVSQVLQDALKGMTQQQQQAALTTLFGSDAIRGAAILSKEGAAGFDEMAASMGKVKAADVAATRMNNLSGRIEQLKGSVETLMIEIGQAFIPILQKVVDALTGFFNRILDLPPRVIAIGSAILASIGALLLLVGVAGKVSLAMMSIRDAMLLATAATTLFGKQGAIATIRTKALAAANAVLNAVMKANPFVLILSLIALLVSAILTLTGSWGKVADIFKPVLNDLKSVFTTLVKAMQPVIRSFTDMANQLARQLAPIFSELITSLLPPIMALFKAIAPLVEALLNIFVALVKPILGLLAPAFEVLGSLISVLVTLLTPLIKIASAILVPVLQVVADILLAVADGIQWLADQLSGFFGSGFDKSLNDFGRSFELMFNQYIKPFFDNMTGAIQPVIDWFQNTAGPAIASFAKDAGTGFGETAKNVGKSWLDMQLAVKPVVDWLYNNVLAPLGTAAKTLGDAWYNLQVTGAKAWLGLQQAVKPIVDWWNNDVLPVIIDFVTKAINKFNDFRDGVAKAWDGIKEKFSPLIDKIVEIKGKWDDLWSNFTSKMEPVVQKVKDLVQGIQDKWQSLMDTIQPLIDKFADIWQKLQDKLGPIFDKIGSLFGKIGDAIGKMFGGGAAGAGAAAGGAGSGATDAQTKGQSFLDFLTTFAESQAFSAIESVLDGISNALDTVGKAFMLAMGVIQGWWISVGKPTWDAIKSIIKSAIDAVQTGMTNFKNTITPIWNSVKDIIKGAIDKIGQTIDNIKGFVDKIPGFFKNVKSFVQDPFGGAKDWLKDAGENIMAGLKAGIEATIGQIKAVLKGVTTLIPSWKGPMELDKVLLKPNGAAIMQSLISGLQSQVGNLKGFLGGLNVSIPADVTSSIAGQVGLDAPATATQAASGKIFTQNNNIYEAYDPALWARTAGREFQSLIAGTELGGAV